jgi:hypothetical protein
MAIQLSNIQSRIERSIFEAIRLITVEAGYLPDIVLFQPPYGPSHTYPTEAAAINAYNLAKSNIKTTKGFCIEIFGNSNIQSKGERKVPRIVITSKRVLSGSVGSSMITYRKVGTEKYQLFQLPFSSVDMVIDITMSTNKVAQERIINAILAESIDSRNYIKFHDNEVGLDERFFMRWEFNRESTDYNTGVTDKINSYRVTDLYIAGERLLRDGIKPITEINVDLQVSDIIINNTNTLKVE